MPEFHGGAFAAWLRLQPLPVARAHLWTCLCDGEADNHAWELWEFVHGDTTLTPGPDALTNALDALLVAIEHPELTDNREV
jgi:hypothetical protein